MNSLRLALILLIIGAIATQNSMAQAPAVAGPECAFPTDPAVIDVQAELGAQGDGIADDTDALQRGIDLSCGLDGKPTRILYLPDGTYRVTRTLVVKSAIGPWIYGESRDGVLIRLDDGSHNCNSVLRTHPSDEGPTSADWFMRNVRNLTIDVGDNPATDGIRWFATNSGILKNVRVVGRGRVGINAGFLGQSGPNLVQDAEVEGFETGILSQWIWGQTLSRIRIRRCSRVGISVTANVAAIEDLVVDGTPLPLLVDYPNDWTWWGGVVALVGARFTGGDPKGPAIRNRSILYARNVAASGSARLIEAVDPAESIVATRLDEYASKPTKRLFDDAPDHSLQLPIKPEPAFPWELDPTRWLCANTFGATAGDNLDDTAAIQKAIDTAAASGKTTVYLRGVGGPDPNWYTVDGTVRVHGSVRHILGLGFGRILGGKNGRFVVDDTSAPIVKFQHLDSFGGPPVALVNQSSNRTMVVESCGVRIVGEGTGDIFATDCPSLVEMRHKGQNFWARQLNPEGDSDSGLVTNAGASIWALGIKCEGRGIRVRTTDGGRTELLGMFVYGPGIDDNDQRPMFDVDNAQLSVAALREIAFDVPTYPIKLRERRGAETRELTRKTEERWIGWSLLRASP